VTALRAAGRDACRVELLDRVRLDGCDRGQARSTPAVHTRTCAVEPVSRTADSPRSAEQGQRGRRRDSTYGEGRGDRPCLTERTQPTCPPIPPALETIESNETTVARRSEGTSWWM